MYIIKLIFFIWKLFSLTINRKLENIFGHILNLNENNYYGNNLLQNLFSET